MRTSAAILNATIINKMPEHLVRLTCEEEAPASAVTATTATSNLDNIDLVTTSNTTTTATLLPKTANSCNSNSTSTSNGNATLSVRFSERRKPSAGQMFCRLVSRTASTDRRPNSVRMNKTLHLTYTLISINTLFFCLVSPLVILACVVNEKYDIQNTKMLYNIVYLLAYSNHSFNFVFYGLSSPPFRETVQSLFAAKKKMTFSSFKRNTIVLDNK
jgi:hypothetical protein